MSGEVRAENLRLIRDSAAAIAPSRGDLRRVRGLRFKAAGFDRAVWREMAGLGWAGLRVNEAGGGSGLGMAEFCALAEELGAGLVPEPLIPCAMAARMLPPGASLDALLVGGRIVVPAWQERANTLHVTGETVLRDGRLSGRKIYVPLAAGADAFLVTVRGGAVVMDARAAGVSVTTEPTQDGGHVGTLTLDGAEADETIPCDANAALDEAALATAASLLGLMERAFAMTLDYLRTREQFGKKIGSFQVLQHRAVDLRLQLALTRASVESAAAVLDAGASGAARSAAVSQAKARASESALLVTRQCIQLHGGIGYTDEADIGLFLRKAMVLASQYGSASVHRARFAALSPETDDE